MVAFKSLLALAACLCASSVVANAAAETAKPTKAAHPIVGITILPYPEKGCKGTSQGNTTVDKGKPACINVGSALSFHLTADKCDEGHLEYYPQADCKGKVSGKSTHKAGCVDKTGTYASFKVDPEKCKK
ncbi:hypothetical protein BJ166DRAFT_493235 [Pestalotiopsis sp. NC0098]|nr:hypothetical protein BJ166DRAFT_493235 [Pestalotiopsis sp. NC0098]